MLNRLVVIILFFAICFPVEAQQKCSLDFVKKEYSVLPGNVVNLPFFIHNNCDVTIITKAFFQVPSGWKIVTQPGVINLAPDKKQFLILSVQIPSDYEVDKYRLKAELHSNEKGTVYSSDSVFVSVSEIEKINLQVLEYNDYVFAGETIKGRYMLQNLGNTQKTFFIEAQNCDVEGPVEIKLNAGESATISVSKHIENGYQASTKEFFTVRAKVADRVLGSVSLWSQVFPDKNFKKDMYHRFPVSASISYLSTSRENKYESTYQFQLYGQGSIDQDGKHRLEFMARGPNNTDLSFLGMYDQYYLSYENKNLEMFAGQKSYSFTPLTESSRYGLGAETRVNFNNGLSLGGLYVEPRFYAEIKNEMAAYAGYGFNKNNRVDVYYVSKDFSAENNPARLVSFVSEFTPFARTNIDFEYSRGYYNNEADNGYRLNLTSQLSVFNISGNLYNTGKNYPGYYTNSRFYSGNVSARISKNMNIGIYAKEDFLNARLDTFFVTAPYTKSMQAYINYNLSPRSNLKLYAREYERKDRLSLNKFHYQTRSLNARFNQKLRKLNYSLIGEMGRTKNFLLEGGKNEQNSFRGIANVAYRFNSKHAVRVFGSWSNINQFVSGNQQNVTAGLSLSSQLIKNLQANLYVQNAYDIDDYYKNRNLMQFDLDYHLLKNHTFSVKSFYTLFRNEVDKPEFTLSATYAIKFGVPVKRIIEAGEIGGIIANPDGQPLGGVLVSLLNETTITDKNGKYEFKFIPPGIHLLTIDKTGFQLDEITNIANPLEVEVFENQLSTVDAQVVKGAYLSGNLTLEKTKVAGLEQVKESAADIIVELETLTEMYRITTDENGRFEFPLVRPGKVVFKIYQNSVPEGYKTVQDDYTYYLKPGENKEITIELPAKQKNVIFKQQGISVLKKSNDGGTGLKVISKKNNPKPEESLYYSVQVGAFKKQLDAGNKFFEGEEFYFEKQIDNLHKYFIGRFKTLKEAKAEEMRLNQKFRKAFVVVIQNGQVYSVREYDQKKKDE